MSRKEPMWTGRGMRILLLSQILTALLLLCVSCAGRASYPVFPIPDEHVATVMDELSAKDAGVKSWLNKLLDLCQQLGTCKEE